MVIEATGAPEPINAALKMAAPAGRVVLLASTRGETQVNFYRDVHKKGLSVLGAHNGARPPLESRPGVWTWQEDAGAVLELLRYGRLEVAHLITHRLPGSEASAAYELLKQWDPGLLGVVLQWNQPGLMRCATPPAGAWVHHWALSRSAQARAISCCSGLSLSQRWLTCVGSPYSLPARSLPRARYIWCPMWSVARMVVGI